jgi:Spy/CpxP family protein refolding chaperone
VWIAAMMFGSSAASANPSGHDHQHSPYAGREPRPVAGLTSEEIRQLLAGNGLGFARPAELNGYPGPRHVLDLAKRLHLSAEQRREVQAIFHRMEARARKLGVQLVAAERRLSDLFRKRIADEASVAEHSATAERLRGELRVAHLNAHLEVTAVLNDEQRRRYSELRGYVPGNGHGMEK